MRQKPQKLALILCVFTFQKNFCYFLGVFSGFHRSAMRCLRLFVCSHRSHFCRKALPCDKNHKNSRRVLGFLACAHGFPDTISGKMRLRIARLACFWGLRVCALFPRCFFGFFACAHGSLGVFSTFSRVRTALLARFRAFIAARCAAYDFLFARTARILPQGSALRQNHKNSRLFTAIFHFVAKSLF